MSRPEHQAPPDIVRIFTPHLTSLQFYGPSEASKYATSSRMMHIQSEMSERALELLALEPDQPKMLLDIGCGSGISGGVLSDAGHTWTGVDISQDMLDIALDREDSSGDLIHMDMGQGLPFRLGMFDGAISVSAIQWLCNADSKAHNPRKRLGLFFSTLYKVLRRGARVALQFYPENAYQSELITSAAIKAGFTGGLVVDFPNSARAKKYFLCLFAGPPSQAPSLPQPMGIDDPMRDTVKVTGHDKRRRRDMRSKMARPSVKSKEWIQHKKEVMRLRGRVVAPDSKYTGRKRSGKFRV